MLVGCNCVVCSEDKMRLIVNLCGFDNVLGLLCFGLVLERNTS